MNCDVLLSNPRQRGFVRVGQTDRFQRFATENRRRPLVIQTNITATC